MLPKERASNEGITGGVLGFYRGSGEVGTGRSRGSTWPLMAVLCMYVSRLRACN